MQALDRSRAVRCQLADVRSAVSLAQVQLMASNFADEYVKGSTCLRPTTADVLQISC